MNSQYYNVSKIMNNKTSFFPRGQKGNLLTVVEVALSGAMGENTVIGSQMAWVSATSFSVGKDHFLTLDSEHELSL